MPSAKINWKDYMIKLEKEYKCHGGKVGYYTHDSAEVGCSMRFSMFSPPEDKQTGAYIIFLSGLSCTEDNFTTKGGAYQKASELGLHVLTPDTSPRGEGIPDDGCYDLGQGAGFYIDAIQEPWAKNFRMESYLIKELFPECEEFFCIDPKKKSITGHSMGGHGSITLYFKYPQKFKSCSAFAPIVTPSQVPWGQKIFESYLGDDQGLWSSHDATLLVKKLENAQSNNTILIDQGMDDLFLPAQLHPQIFEKACKQAGQKLMLRQQDGYDHGYFFIQTFINDHLEWHKNYLCCL